jgi:hypothetical protein
MLFWDESPQSNAAVLIADRDEGLVACAANRRVHVIDLSQIRTFLLTNQAEHAFCPGEALIPDEAHSLSRDVPFDNALAKEPP